MEMKRWEAPKIEIEVFQANEYVSACWNGTITLQCAIPGSDPNRVDDYWSKYWAGQGAYKDEQGLWHGACADASEVSFSGRTGTESNGGVISNVVIGSSNSSGYYTSNVQLNTSTVIENGVYSATWDSYGAGSTYHHYGAATVSNVTRGHNLS